MALRGTGIRSCPACGRLFVITGAQQQPIDLNPAAPILIYTGEIGKFPVGQCPHCKKAITSDAFPASGQCIPANVPMLESTCQELLEDAPLTIPSLSTKLSQDDPEHWIRVRNRGHSTE
mgnify:CR=1